MIYEVINSEEMKVQKMPINPNDFSGSSGGFDGAGQDFYAMPPGVMDVFHDVFGNFVSGSAASPMLLEEEGFNYNELVDAVNGINAAGEGTALVVMLDWMVNPDAHSKEEWITRLANAFGPNATASRVEGLEFGTDGNGNFTWSGTLVYE